MVVVVVCCVVSNPGRFEITSLDFLLLLKFVLLCNDPNMLLTSKGTKANGNIPHVNVIEFHYILFFIAKAKQMMIFEAQDT